VSLVLNAEDRRLSKRDGAVTLPELANAGLEAPEVVRRLLASLGSTSEGIVQAVEAFHLSEIPRRPLVYRPEEWRIPDV
jgi:glutamyl-tRNA synthetase